MDVNNSVSATASENESVQSSGMRSEWSFELVESIDNENETEMINREDELITGLEKDEELNSKDEESDYKDEEKAREEIEIDNGYSKQGEDSEKVDLQLELMFEEHEHEDSQDDKSSEDIEGLISDLDSEFHQVDSISRLSTMSPVSLTDSIYQRLLDIEPLEEDPEPANDSTTKTYILAAIFILPVVMSSIVAYESQRIQSGKAPLFSNFKDRMGQVVFFKPLNWAVHQATNGIKEWAEVEDEPNVESIRMTSISEIDENDYDELSMMIIDFKKAGGTFDKLKLVCEDSNNQDEQNPTWHDYIDQVKRQVKAFIRQAIGTMNHFNTLRLQYQVQLLDQLETQGNAAVLKVRRGTDNCIKMISEKAKEVAENPNFTKYKNMMYREFEQLKEKVSSGQKKIDELFNSTNISGKLDDTVKHAKAWLSKYVY